MNHLENALKTLDGLLEVKMSAVFQGRIESIRSDVRAAVEELPVNWDEVGEDPPTVEHDHDPETCKIPRIFQLTVLRAPETVEHPDEVGAEVHIQAHVHGGDEMVLVSQALHSIEADIDEELAKRSAATILHALIDHGRSTEDVHLPE